MVRTLFRILNALLEIAVSLDVTYDRIPLWYRPCVDNSIIAISLFLLNCAGGGVWPTWM